jgi:hypothetical protein
MDEIKGLRAEIDRLRRDLGSLEGAYDTLSQQTQMMMAFINSLKAAGTIPYDVDEAITDRIKRKAILGLTVSGKDLDSEDQTVQEGGALSYSVLGDPDGFLEVTIGGVVYYIPYYG